MKEINDLYDYGYKIVQKSDYFKFSLDSMLLANFVNINMSDSKLLDFCTGNCPIPIILSNSIKNIVAFEVQKEIYELGDESLKLNNINNVKLINDDIKNIGNYYEEGYFDIITCNPPYFKVIDSSRINDNNVKAIARHEILIKLEDIVSLAYKFLRDKGKLYIVYRPDRLMELLKLFDKYKFGVKKLQCCYNNSDSLSSMILIEAMKNGQDDLKILAPLYTENYRR
ncbi:MAG: methyltransferase [Tenericutes bacterium]|nr:methyltransferase [Mycoplasmatota bacterium]